jgi:hypothetical protein
MSMWGRLSIGKVQLTSFTTNYLFTERSAYAVYTQMSGEFLKYRLT